MTETQTISSPFPPDLKELVRQAEWTFAKTMPEWPHEYLVRDKLDDLLFERLVMHIRTHGYSGWFYRKSITYFEEEGKVYWTMGAPLEETVIINRCAKEDTFEYRQKHDLLPTKA